MLLSLSPVITSMVAAAGAVGLECGMIRACVRMRVHARIAPRARVPFVLPPRSRLLVCHTGHEFLTDETVLDPHHERHMATFFLKARPQEHFFDTCGCRAASRGPP